MRETISQKSSFSWDCRCCIWNSSHTLSMRHFQNSHTASSQLTSQVYSLRPSDGQSPSQGPQLEAGKSGSQRRPSARSSCLYYALSGAVLPPEMAFTWKRSQWGIITGLFLRTTQWTASGSDTLTLTTTDCSFRVEGSVCFRISWHHP